MLIIKFKDFLFHFIFFIKFDYTILIIRNYQEILFMNFL